MIAIMEPETPNINQSGLKDGKHNGTSYEEDDLWDTDSDIDEVM